jgi:pyruvate dehydrogenase E1 component alpha subunit
MSDPATYRSKEEVKDKKENDDPIDNLRKFILEGDIASESEITAIDKKIKEEISEIAEFAKNSPEPDESELMTDIYTENN